MSTYTDTAKVARYWNMRGATYSRSWRSYAKQRLNEIELQIITDALRKTLKNKRKKIKVLDIGVAIGRISAAILKYDVELYGIDISKEMINICKDRFAGNNKVKKFTIHDIHKSTPKSWGKFDFVTGIRVISYSKEWKKQLQIIFESLNTDGVLVFTFPNRISTHIISTRLRNVKLQGVDTTYTELIKTLQNLGYTRIKIYGLTRLLDSMYDFADNKMFSNCIYFVEKVLEKILGKILFARLFYVVCQK